MGYAFVVLIQSGGNLAAVQGVLLVRGVLSPAAHMAWTGLTAAALWQAADRGWRAPAVVRFLVVFAVAVALHTAWDSISSQTGYAIVAGLSLLLLIITTHRLHLEAHRRVGDPFPVESSNVAWERHTGAV